MWIKVSIFCCFPFRICSKTLLVERDANRNVKHFYKYPTSFSFFSLLRGPNLTNVQQFLLVVIYSYVGFVWTLCFCFVKLASIEPVCCSRTHVRLVQRKLSVRICLQILFIWNISPCQLGCSHIRVMSNMFSVTISFLACMNSLLCLRLFLGKTHKCMFICILVLAINNYFSVFLFPQIFTMFFAVSKFFTCGWKHYVRVLI